MVKKSDVSCWKRDERDDDKENATHSKTLQRLWYPRLSHGNQDAGSYDACSPRAEAELAFCHGSVKQGGNAVVIRAKTHVV